MKNKKRTIFEAVLIVVAIVAIVALCFNLKLQHGTSEMYTSDTYADTSYSNDNSVATQGKMMGAETASYSDNGTDSGATSETVQDTSRKLVTTVSIDAETENFDETVAGISKKTDELKGYIESSDIGTNSYGDFADSKYANLSIRVPADQLDSFLSDVNEACNVTYTSKNVEDITLQYVDTDSHLKALQAELDKLNAIMKKAETVDEIIAVEDKISDVQYQINTIQSQLNVYDNEVDYSTVNIYLTEVVTYSPAGGASISERISKGFAENMAAIKDGFVNLFIWVVVHIIQIIVLAIIIVVVLVILKKRKKSVKAKTEAESLQQK